MKKSMQSLLHDQKRRDISSIFSSNSEANASEVLENMEEFDYVQRHVNHGES